ncbi:MAG: carotenoid oxygenase family protein [Frankiaceae bacterium]|nr:carotenoid oxygenase family protein [Frankiaceae bacterium]
MALEADVGATAGNPYLEGNFGPVAEELTTGELEVTGRLPEWLDGRYLRIGPNPLGAVNPETYHWFVGHGMAHGVRLRDGRAEWYRNRYVRSDAVAAALGEPARPGGVQAGFDFAANTNIVQHSGRTLALVEGGARPYELNETLDTVARCDFDGTLRGGYTAHPHMDPATGELHSISYFWAWGNRVRYDVIGTDGRVRRSTDITTHGRASIHDFALTENFVVILDLPVAFDTKRVASSVPPAMRPFAKATLAAVSRIALPPRVAAVLGGGADASGDSAGSTMGFPYSWDPSYPARVGLLPREGSNRDVQWYDVSPGYVFHVMNAYEEGDTIVCDVVRHPKMFATERRGPQEGVPTLDRWTIDRAAGKVIEDRLDSSGQEFPRIDERLTGRRHRYGYAVGVDPDSANCVIKHDLVAGDREVKRLGGAADLASEFVFVPSPHSVAEDDGVLMGFVYHADTDRSDLTLLDATSLETMASVHLPARVPQGFHGNWAPASV